MPQTKSSVEKPKAGVDAERERRLKQRNMALPPSRAGGGRISRGSSRVLLVRDSGPYYPIFFHRCREVLIFRSNGPAHQGGNGSSGIRAARKLGLSGENGNDEENKYLSMAPQHFGCLCLGSFYSLQPMRGSMAKLQSLARAAVRVFFYRLGQNEQSEPPHISPNDHAEL